MKTCLTIGLAAIASAAAAITPSVTDVTMEQDPLTRNVAVGYVLSGRAVVPLCLEWGRCWSEVGPSPER